LIKIKKILSIFDRAWLLFLPISSFLIIPSIQGTTPGQIFAFLSLLVVNVFCGHAIKSKFNHDLIVIVSTFIFLNLLSQLTLSLSNPNLSNLPLINNRDYSVLLRQSLFTQSLYLIAAVICFLYFKYFYSRNLDKYIFLSIIFLASYGIYELIFFAIFHKNGDFITNRLFDDFKVPGYGSLFQVLQIGSLSISRIKSLTGEPSMYSLTVLPFWIYSFHCKRYKTSFFIMITLLLTFSTMAYLGLLIYLFFALIFSRFRYKHLYAIFIGSFFIVIILLIINREFVFSLANQIFIEKPESNSGIERYEGYTTTFNFFINSSIFSKLFGIGFGYVRSTDFFSTLLVNNGIIGFTIYSLFFIYPVVKLDNTFRNTGLKLSLIVIYFIQMIGVPEYSYLSSWLFLGISYNELRMSKLLKTANYVTV
jgi:hypothetical protein